MDKSTNLKFEQIKMTESELFNMSPVAQLVISPVDDTILAANEQLCRLCGISYMDIMKLPVSYLFSPNFPTMIVFTDELIEKKHAWSDQLLLKCINGDIRIEVKGIFYEDFGGRQIHLTIQQSDELDVLRQRSDAHRHYISGIGHWNRVNQVFQEFERENQLILDAVGEGIYGVDVHGMTTFVNPAAERILGYTAEELAGRNMHSTIHHSQADGSHFCVNDCPIFEAVRDGTVHTVEDDTFWSKSGKPIDVEYTSTPIRDNGIIVGAVVIFHDTSQKKIDKKRLVEALEEVEKLKNQLELENAYLQEEIDNEFNHHQIIGKSPAIQKVAQQIKLVAPTDATVLICGESGTGKELIARAIHDMSDRSHRPLIRVNCAAIPEDLFESEFFGHAKGSFTGATSNRTGRFEVADGGTLFLDEVGELPLHLQGKLLRVIQEQQFERVGESETRHVDVRLIAATNRDLKKQVILKKFREDLYFRLNVFPIESVPLRERTDDIPLLTQHFLKRASSRARKSNLRVSLSEIEKLKNYNWPGNIRELENVIERQVILAPNEIVRFDDLVKNSQISHKTIDDNNETVLTHQEIKSNEQKNLIQALTKTNGKVFGINGAADLLGMKPTTVASRIKKYKIDTRQFKQ